MKIKNLFKHIISSALIITVLLPFAVQFLHSFEHHDHFCSENDIHIDIHELDCSVFHFHINQNSIDFPSEEILTEITVSENIIFTIEEQKSSVNLHYKSSRAPPYLLI